MILEQWLTIAIVAFLFLILALISSHSVYDMRHLQDLTVASSGILTRKLLYIMFSIANFVRVVSLLAGLGLGVNLSGFSIWWHTVLSGVPSLLFQIAFSILIMFWAQLYYRSTRTSRPKLKLCFFTFNLTICVTSLSMTIFSAVNKLYEQLITDYFILNCTVFIIGFIFIIYYGVQVIIQLQPRRFEAASDNRNNVLGRILATTVLCAVICLLRSTFDILIISGAIRSSDGYPCDTDGNLWIPDYYFDAALFLSCEWLPCAFILFTMKKRQVAESTNGGNSVDGGDISRPLLSDSGDKFPGLINSSHVLPQDR